MCQSVAYVLTHIFFLSLLWNLFQFPFSCVHVFRLTGYTFRLLVLESLHSLSISLPNELIMLQMSLGRAPSSHCGAQRETSNDICLFIEVNNTIIAAFVNVSWPHCLVWKEGIDVFFLSASKSQCLTTAPCLYLQCHV